VHKIFPGIFYHGNLFFANDEETTKIRTHKNLVSHGTLSFSIVVSIYDVCDHSYFCNCLSPDPLFNFYPVLICYIVQCTSQINSC